MTGAYDFIAVGGNAAAALFLILTNNWLWVLNMTLMVWHWHKGTATLMKFVMNNVVVITSEKTDTNQ